MSRASPGTPRRSSTRNGDGAIYEAARIVHAFRERMAGEPHLTFNPGVIVGGTSTEFDMVESRGSAFGKTNVVAGTTTVYGDLRALTMPQFEKAMATMRAIAAESLPKTKAQISFDEGYPPLAPTAGNERLLVIYDQASRDLGLGSVSAVSPDKAGAADVSFIAAEVPMIIDAVGLKGRRRSSAAGDGRPAHAAGADQTRRGPHRAVAASRNDHEAVEESEVLHGFTPSSSFPCLRWRWHRYSVKQ